MNDDKVSAAIDEFVKVRTGLCLNTLSGELKWHLVHAAMEGSGARSPLSYLERLQADPRVFDEFIAKVTVPETYFFRDPALFAGLRTEFLPELYRARGATRRLRIWSAGCASGEEPYSIAILLDQLGMGGCAHIVGSDISKRILERANRAHYGPWSLRNVPSGVRDQYFQATERGFQLDDRIRRRVEFQHHNLSDPRPPLPAAGELKLDLILCRNVFIYFSREKTQEVSRRLVSLLDGAGWLITGPSDPPLALGDLCEVRATPFGLCYRRNENAFSWSPRGAPHAPASPAKVSETRTALPKGLGPKTLARPATPTARLAQPAAAQAEPPLERLRALANEHGSAAAEAACREALTAQPLDPELHCLHALLLLDLRRERDAEAAVRRALYLDDALPIAHYLRGMLAARRGDRAVAMQAYLRCQETCRREAPTTAAKLGDGILHPDLWDAARVAARHLSRDGNQT